ncbi:hypothetical protein Tco_1149912 [Tanacetum coccineum]
MISKVNLLWKTASEKLDDTPLCDTAGGPTAQINFTSTDYHIKEELRRKGIKSLSKLLSPKYLSQSSIIEQNKNPSSPKLVYFINLIIILNKENEAEEEVSLMFTWNGGVLGKLVDYRSNRAVDNKTGGNGLCLKEIRKIYSIMPKKLDMFKHVDFVDRGTDSIPPFVIESDDDNYEKPYYSDILDLGPEYKFDEYVCRGIQSLMAAKAKRKNKGEVM